MARAHGLWSIGSIAFCTGCSLLIDPDDRTFEGPAAPGQDRFSGQGAACPLAAGEPNYVKPGQINRSAWFSSVLAADANTVVAIAPTDQERSPRPGTNGDRFITNAGKQFAEVPVGAGSVHFFEREDAGWAETTRAVVEGASLTLPLIPSDQMPPMLELLLVPAFSAQVLGQRAAIGLSVDSRRQEFGGSVRWFERDATGWQEQPVPLEEAKVHPGDLFGQTLALAEDALFVGAPATEVKVPGEGEATEAENAGVVYAYRRAGAGYEKLGPPLTSPFPNSGAGFGAALAVSDEWFVVGAPLEDSDAPDSHNPVRHETPFADGAVYAYGRTEAGLARPERVEPEGYPQLGFGASVALLGDTLVVGAPIAPGCGQANADVPVGQVHVFRRTDHFAQEKCIDGAQSYALFGFAVAITDRVIAVAAPWSSSAGPGMASNAGSGEAGSGAVFLYDRANLDAPPCVIKAPNADPEDALGVALVGAAHSLFVGAPFEDGAGLGPGADPNDNANLDTGALYVIDLAQKPAF